MESEEGYLGPFNWQLEVRDIQHFIFTPAGKGNLWMSEKEQEERCFNRYTRVVKQKTMSVKELIVKVMKKCRHWK